MSFLVHVLGPVGVVTLIFALLLGGAVYALDDFTRLIASQVGAGGAVPDSSSSVSPGLTVTARAGTYDDGWGGEAA